MLALDTAPRGIWACFAFRDQSWGTVTIVGYACKHLLHTGICQETADGIHLEGLARFVVVHTLHPILSSLMCFTRSHACKQPHSGLIYSKDAAAASLVSFVQLLVQCADLVVSTRLYFLFLSVVRVVQAARNLWGCGLARVQGVSP